MLGKAKCKILKEIRQKIADENDIPYVTRECTYQGDCSGTCPRCESELRYLERELEARRRLGNQVAVTALCTGIALSTAGCNGPSVFDDRNLGGAAELPPEEVLRNNDPDTGSDGNDSCDIELEGETAITPEDDSSFIDTGITGDISIDDGETEIYNELTGDVVVLPDENQPVIDQELAGAAEPWEDTVLTSGEIIPTPKDAFVSLISFASTFNSQTVSNGVKYCPLFTADKNVTLRALTTYHWNDGLGAAPGFISIYDVADGEETLLGIWGVTVRGGNGAENVNWDIFPDIELLAGHTYHIVDSDPATWSSNAESGEMGFVELFTDEGIKAGGTFSPCEEQ